MHRIFQLSLLVLLAVVLGLAPFYLETWHIFILVAFVVIAAFVVIVGRISDGIFLNPIVTSLALRPILSVGAGFIAAFAVFTADRALGAHVLMGETTLALAGLLSLWFALNDNEPEVVPVPYAAVVTFLGMRTPFYLTEGTHPWIGKKFFLDRFRGPTPGFDQAKFPPAKEGLVFIGEYVIQIWDEATKKDVIVLSNVARDTSTVFSNLTIVIKIVDLRKWINSSDPVFDIAERARAAFRTAISYFTGVDCASVKTLLGQLMIGKIILVSFIKKAVDSNAANSMVQDKSGAHLCQVLKDNDEATIAAERVRFEQRLVNDADTEMLKAASINGNPVVETRSIDHHLIDVIEGVGATLIRVSISDFTMSDEVAERANRAAGEAFQRTAQVLSARAVREAQKILAEGGTEPGNDLATILAAAQDNDRVSVVYVPGGDRLTRAAVAGGKQIGGKK